MDLRVILEKATQASSETRSEVLYVKLYPQEKLIIDGTATSIGATVSDFVRAVMLAACNELVKPDPQEKYPEREE